MREIEEDFLIQKLLFKPVFKPDMLTLRNDAIDNGFRPIENLLAIITQFVEIEKDMQTVVAVELFYYFIFQFH